MIRLNYCLGFDRHFIDQINKISNQNNLICLINSRFRKSVSVFVVCHCVCVSLKLVM